MMNKPYLIREDLCSGCLACVENCPAQALRVTREGERVTISHNLARCARCGLCWRNCPEGAILLEDLTEGRWVEAATFKVVFCSRCGGVVASEAQIQKLPEEDRKGEPLCERCRRLVEGERWAQWVRPKEVLR